MVNNFGYGGTNAITILEGRPPKLNHVIKSAAGSATETTDNYRSSASPWKLFTFSARTAESLIKFTDRFDAWLPSKQISDLDNISYTLSRRTRHSYRHFVVADSTTNLREKLGNVERGSPKVTRRSVFVFTGQGAQWARMGCELMQFHQFTASMHRSQDILGRLGASWNLLQELGREAAVSRMNESEISQPATTALQIGIIDTLRSWNLIPDAVVGHSSGEIAAAYTAGLLTHEAALAVSYHRGSVTMKDKLVLENPAGMLAVGLSGENASESIRQHGLQHLISVEIGRAHV